LRACVGRSRGPWLLDPPARDWLAAPRDWLAAEPSRDWLAVEPSARETRSVVREALTDAAVMLFRDDAGGDGPILEGRMLPYNEWTEVKSRTEGHSLERFAPGSLASNAVAALAKRIRVLFEHGMDAVLGRQVIARIEELRDQPDGAYFRARLLEGVPPLIVAGLRSGLYGSSIRFEPIEQDRVRAPRRSDYNPGGLPEHTTRQARVREFSVVAFPQYAGATAQVRIAELKEKR
jgi:phage head maturation protease